MKSKFFKINLKDVKKSIIVAILTAIIGSINAGTENVADIVREAVQYGGTALIGYLTKNLFTNSKDEFFKVENNNNQIDDEI